MNPQRQPELQRIHAACPWGANIGVMGQLSRRRFLKERKGNEKGPLKYFGMPGKEETRRKRHGQPLMRIESNRIGVLDSANQSPIPVREKQCNAISAVNVEPDVGAATNFMNPRYFVDYPRASRSGRSHKS